VEIYDSTFQSNQAISYGGGISATNANVEIHDTVFLTNIATGYACTYSGNSCMTSADCPSDWDSCDGSGIANGAGGAIYASDANVELVQVTFFPNIPGNVGFVAVPEE
jgi:predicted outer membrane repeat protein